jgi:hypothetical protein
VDPEGLGPPGRVDDGTVGVIDTMTRRTLLWIASLGALLGLTGCARRDGLARAPGPDAPATGPLSAHEMEDLLAFAEILVEGRPLEPVERGYLTAHIEDRVARLPASLSLYRRTVTLLGRLAGTRFSALDRSERVALVAHHRLSSHDVRPGETLGPFPDDIRAVRGRVVRDLIGGYYGSPAGWTIVGYTAVFPGRCGELERYTRPES